MDAIIHSAQRSGQHKNTADTHSCSKGKFVTRMVFYMAAKKMVDEHAHLENHHKQHKGSDFYYYYNVRAVLDTRKGREGGGEKEVFAILGV